MGILSNTVSLYQYRVRGTRPEGDFEAWVGRKLMENRFMNIEKTADESSTGWVVFDNHQGSDFTNPNTFTRDHYYVFSLRRDQRKVPAILLKTMLEAECEKWLSERPSISRVPTRRRLEIREDIHASLIARSLPIPSACDVVWDTRSDTVSVTSISTRVLDMVEDEFSRTFEGFLLEPIHPISRAERVLDKSLHGALERANQAPSKDVLLQIKKNRWLGWEFLLWLMYRTSTGSSMYEINQDGPALRDERFLSYLHDRFVLSSEGEDGIRKSSIIGPQRNFSEARRAIQDGKNITEALLYFEKDSLKWKMSLKSDLFAFGSFACPAVTIARDDRTDPVREREAAFFERMNLLETGLQLFNSIYAAFLSERLQGKWQGTIREIRTWLNQ